MTPVVIGLGGNLGGEQAIVARMRAACSAFATWAEVSRTACSALYRSAPVGGRGQAPFVNGAVLLRWRAAAQAIDAVELLARLLALEVELGRERGRARMTGAPRTIDLDLWLIGAREIHLPGPPAVVVPHPRLAGRAFALVPLLDLLGARARVPGSGVTIATLLAAPTLRSQPIARLPYTLRS